MENFWKISVCMAVVGLWLMVVSLLCASVAAVCNLEELACANLMVAVIAGCISIIGVVLMFTITMIDT